MLKDYYAIRVFLESGKKFEYEQLEFDQSYTLTSENLTLNIQQDNGVNVKIEGEGCDKIIKVEYQFTLKMKNYAKVIVPDSGRWFLKNTSLIDFWKNCQKFSSNISDIKIPLFMFLRNDFYVGNAVGIVGKNLETEFRIIEPESNRALNVHTGHIILGMTRGSDIYPLNSSKYNESIFYYNANTADRKPWLLVQRAFAAMQRQIYSLNEQYLKSALEPMWCSWVDWDSKDINEEMLLSNMKAGVKLGIKNFIIDDGWYGNGLDSDYSVDMNIGDWEPDEKKIPDMKGLVEKAHQFGARPIIWCAPHAVAGKSKAFEKNRDYLISDEHGDPVLNEPQYYSYCFQNENAREIMSDICVKLIEKWDFDGSKYDLFNWVPNCQCKNPNHKHDLNSMIEGLEMTLKLIDQKMKKIKPDHIVELKQNYGTLFHMQYGNLMRAGDSPFDIETNYQRTLHIQSYTPFALNDYQTFTEEDKDEDVACSIIKMLAAGVPAYGVNFEKLQDDVSTAIKYYNNLYMDHIEDFRNFRIPLNPDNTAMMINGKDQEYIFLLPHCSSVELSKNSLIFNGTYDQSLIIKSINHKPCEMEIRDCKGHGIKKIRCQDYISEISVPVGGTIMVCFEE